MTRNETSGTALFILLAFISLSLIGWIANIVKLAGMEASIEMTSISGMMILRVSGIFFPPLGVVLGFC